MKKIFIVIIAGILALSACKKNVLDRLPLDEINDATFWAKPEDLASFANQFYPTLINANNFWRIDDGSDNHVPSSVSPFIWGQYVIPSSGGGWDKSDWASIRSCNYFLERYHRVEGNPDLINAYVGEVRFFRAFYYFDKIKMFGDVPWIGKELQINSEELYNARDSRKLVTDSILKDLDFAIANLPERSSDDRLTKNVALAFKSRVCLFEGTFRKYHGLGDYEAVLRKGNEASEALINSGKYGIYSTGHPLDDYYDFFILNDYGITNEGIMWQKFEYDKVMHGRARRVLEGSTGYSKDFAEGFLCTDGMPISLSPLYQGDAHFDDEFVNRDPRMKQSIYTMELPITVSNAGAVSYQQTPEFNTQRCNTGYRIIKFFSPHQNDLQQDRAIKPTIIFRYPEVLLNYAESKAELGEINQDILDRTINLLRDRVNMPHLQLNVGFTDPSWPDWEVPVSPLINEVRRERRIELSAEGFRFDDIRRWKAGKLLNNIKTYIGAREPATSQYHIVYPGLTRTWNDKLYFYPIPTQELVLNPQFTQNPGWQ